MLSLNIKITLFVLPLHGSQLANPKHLRPRLHERLLQQTNPLNNDIFSRAATLASPCHSTCGIQTLEPRSKVGSVAASCPDRSWVQISAWRLTFLCEAFSGFPLPFQAKRASNWAKTVSCATITFSTVDPELLTVMRKGT